MTNNPPEQEARELEARAWASEYWDDEAESASEVDALKLARAAGASGYLAGQAVGRKQGFLEALEEVQEAAIEFFLSRKMPTRFFIEEVINNLKSKAGGE